MVCVLRVQPLCSLAKVKVIAARCNRSNLRLLQKAHYVRLNDDEAAHTQRIMEKTRRSCEQRTAANLK
jgi:hypothetical protein